MGRKQQPIKHGVLGRFGTWGRRVRVHLYRTGRGINPNQMESLLQELNEESQLSTSYLVLIVSSCVIATLGLLSNSAAVIIGAMIIAPLMLPIRGLAFGALEGHVFLFRRGLFAVVVGSLLAVAISCGLGLLSGLPAFGSEVLSRSQPNLLDLGIAIAAGGVSGYAKVQPKVSGSLAGTAIAVALMPPICVIGLGASHGDLALSWGAFLLYLTNLLGITLSCMVAFLLCGYTPIARARRALTWAASFTAVLLVPLGISFTELVRQSHLETSLKRALLDRTVTFQRVDLIDIDTNWLASPPSVQLTVRAAEAVSPKQVRLLEEFVTREMGQPFTLIFYVSAVEEVVREQSIDASQP